MIPGCSSPMLLNSARPIALTISSLTADYNLFTAAGSPTTAVDITLTIASGIKVYSTSTANPAINYGALPASSSVKIVNTGYIMGMGGNGSPTSVAVVGGNGGPALSLGVNTVIDNTSGYIGGGGGGGGGATGLGGGGGGAGAGVGGTGTATGTGGNGTASGGGGGSDNVSYAGGGGNGSRVLPGTGGAGFAAAISGGNGGAGSAVGASAAGGGGGGGWGAAGGSGGTTAGGAGGKAVALNGYSVTWLGGNNSTQVLGVVA